MEPLSRERVVVEKVWQPSRLGGQSARASGSHDEHDAPRERPNVVAIRVATLEGHRGLARAGGDSKVQDGVEQSW